MDRSNDDRRDDDHRDDDQDPTQRSDAVKDPDDWTTGDEPMTGPQASYLATLSREADEPPPEGLTKAEASKRIDELQEKTGRGDGDHR